MRKASSDTAAAAAKAVAKKAGASAPPASASAVAVGKAASPAAAKTGNKAAIAAAVAKSAAKATGRPGAKAKARSPSPQIRRESFLSDDEGESTSSVPAPVDVHEESILQIQQQIKELGLHEQELRRDVMQAMEVEQREHAELVGRLRETVEAQASEQRGEAEAHKARLANLEAQLEKSDAAWRAEADGLVKQITLLQAGDTSTGAYNASDGAAGVGAGPSVGFPRRSPATQLSDAGAAPVSLADVMSWSDAPVSASRAAGAAAPPSGVRPAGS